MQKNPPFIPSGSYEGATGEDNNIWSKRTRGRKREGGEGRREEGREKQKAFYYSGHWWCTLRQLED